MAATRRRREDGGRREGWREDGGGVAGAFGGFGGKRSRGGMTCERIGVGGGLTRRSGEKIWTKF
jgi:hypothetical protein